jgi:S1-C subfamily serine protease
MVTRRGRLGINVDLRPDAARDSVGALVAGVTPGGPAERAGVRAGDVVVRLNGTRLASAAAGDVEDAEQSRPAMRLVRLSARLDDGDTVRLELRRDGRSQTVTFRAEESDVDRIVIREFQRQGEPFAMTIPRTPAAPRAPTVTVTPAPGGATVRGFYLGSGVRDLELVKVNAGLGEYFGTSDGLLVVNVGADSALNLRAGDVILGIGGRRPTSPTHAMRILGTYDENEEIRFEVMRQKRRTNVTGRMPQPGHAEWRVRPNSFDITVPRMHEDQLRQHEEQLRHLMEDELPRIRMRLEETLPRLRQTRPETQRILQPKVLVRTDGEV